jgi:hypothetical protein
MISLSEKRWHEGGRGGNMCGGLPENVIKGGHMGEHGLEDGMAFMEQNMLEGFGGVEEGCTKFTFPP